MSRSSRLIRLAIAALCGAALTLPPALPALAQEAPPPRVWSDSDPPARVGRLTDLSGGVSFHGPGADHWSPATPNFPITSGDAVWTEPGARAAIEVSGDRITLAGGTEFDVDALDDQTLSASVPQGELYLRIRAVVPGEVVTLRTPRGTVSISAPGRYDIAAGDTNTPTTVTVLSGSAQVNGDTFGVVVRPGETATITGDSPFVASVGPEQRTPFLTAMLQEALPPPPPGVAPPPVVEAMSGADDLTAYGTWQPTPQYGTVWYPNVAPGWAPYRDGHWAYVEPWGWTWVDDEPWGFAPFHYGRWVQIGGAWAWAPVYVAPGYAPPPVVVAPPVYAPALVTFFGVGVGIGVGIGLGHDCGWVPLGWGEPYVPWYRHGRDYLVNVNRSYVPNVTNITNITNVTNVTVNHFANARAATMVPAAAIINSRPIAPVVRPVPPQQLAALRPAPIPPVRPTAGTLGVTPAVAHQLRLPPAPPGAPVRPVAPGPRFQPLAPSRPAATPLALRVPVAPTAPGAAPVAPHMPMAPAAPGAPRPVTNALPTVNPAASVPHVPGTAGPGVIQPHGPAAPGLPPLRAPAAPQPMLNPGVAAPTAPAAPHPVLPPPQAGHLAPPAAAMAPPRPGVTPNPPPLQPRSAALPPVHPATPPQVHAPAPLPQLQPQAIRPPPMPQPQAFRPPMPQPQPQVFRAPQAFQPPPQPMRPPAAPPVQAYRAPPAPAPAFHAPAPPRPQPQPQHQCIPGRPC
jgi:hypothetical protein